MKLIMFINFHHNYQCHALRCIDFCPYVLWLQILACGLYFCVGIELYLLWILNCVSLNDVSMTLIYTTIQMPLMVIFIIRWKLSSASKIVVTVLFLSLLPSHVFSRVVSSAPLICYLNRWSLTINSITELPLYKSLKSCTMPYFW